MQKKAEAEAPTTHTPGQSESATTGQNSAILVFSNTTIMLYNNR